MHSPTGQNSFAVIENSAYGRQQPFELEKYNHYFERSDAIYERWPSRPRCFSLFLPRPEGAIAIKPSFEKVQFLQFSNLYNMHTFELQRNIQSLFADTMSFEPFTTTLASLSKSAEAMNLLLPGLAAGGVGLSNSANQVHAHLVNARQAISTTNHRQFYKALEHFQRIIAQLQPANASNTGRTSSLANEVEEFSSLYDAFLSNQSGENALPLLLIAQRLHCKIGAMFDTLQLVEESIGGYDVPGVSETPFTLLLPAHLELAEFARRLIAIQNLYSELCMLLSVSESTHPLRISKIESGSLWAKLFGESKVIELMASFVSQTASWIFRSYTIEGKIESVPRKVEAIDALLGLKKRLEEAGIATSEIKEHIEKSAVAISKSLAEILDGQPSVTINEKTISVGSEIGKEMLERTAPLQLANKNLVTNSAPPTLPPSN